MDTDYVANCIFCVKAGKCTPATNWTGFVVRLTDEESEGVVAGSCAEHRADLLALPHREHLSQQRHCVGLWVPEYGRRD